jgi:hypothetical protein
MTGFLTFTRWNSPQATEQGTSQSSNSQRDVNSRNEDQNGNQITRDLPQQLTVDPGEYD